MSGEPPPRPAVGERVEPPPRPAVGERPTVTRDRRERQDPHDPPVPGNVRRLRPAEIHNAPPGRRAPARDAASRQAADAPAPAFDFATGRRQPAPAGPAARVLPPSRSSPPPSAPPEGPGEHGRTVGLKGRLAPGGPGAGGPAGRWSRTRTQARSP